MKSLILGSLLCLAGVAHASEEIAAYNAKKSSDTIIVTRDKGKVTLLLCTEVFPGLQDAKDPMAALLFMQANCSAPTAGNEDGLSTSVTANYITGNTESVVSIAQTYLNPPNGSAAGELFSTMNTYLINTYVGNPVGPNDTVVYTGTQITHDHAATPKVSTSRLTYELQAVTRLAP